MYQFDNHPDATPGGHKGRHFEVCVPKESHVKQLLRERDAKDPDKSKETKKRKKAAKTADEQAAALRQCKKTYPAALT